MANQKKYKCPYCEYRAIRSDLIDHVEEEHEDLIPKGYTSARIVYNVVNKKTKGTCMICHKETEWDETKQRYNSLCKNQKCKQEYVKIVRSRMVKKYGTYNLLKDAEFQKKMLEGRSISGKYKFEDGGSVGYVGGYEKKFLEFMDKFLHIKSYDIMSPGPNIPYMYKGKEHVWITDYFYEPYNLVFDIKDGGNNPNTRDMKEYREKQLAKEKAIAEYGDYNYIRLTDNKFEQLILLMMELKEKEDSKKPIIRINESVIAESESVIKTDYTPKSKKSLSSFKRVHITESVINRYKKEYPFLSHVRCKDTKEYICDGYIWFDNDELVCMVGSCEYRDDETKWIVSLEIAKNYKGYELSKQILDYATKTMKCKCLSVNKNNEVAKKVYDGYGFKVYYEDESMYYMTIDSNASIKESFETRIVHPLLPKQVTVYHGSSEKSLDMIKPVSYNMGTKLSNPRTSSFWFLDIQYAKAFSILQLVAKNLNKRTKLFIDYDMKALFPEKYKSEILNILKLNDSYVYEKNNVNSKYLGVGHNKLFPEYTLDFQVRPDNIITVSYPESLNLIRFESESYINRRFNEFYGKHKSLIYYTGEGLLNKNKEIKSYTQDLNLNESNVIKELEFIKDDIDLSNWMKKNIKYKNYTKLMSPNEVYEQKKGSCHDQVMFELHYLRRLKLNPSALFLIEYNKEGKGTSNVTHSLVYYKKENKYYWFENAWGGKEGIHEFNSIDDLKDELIKLHNNGKFGNDKLYPELEITRFGSHKPGETLQELVDKCLGKSINESYIRVDIDMSDLTEEMLISAANNAAHYTKWCKMDDSKFCNVYELESCKVKLEDAVFCFAKYTGNEEDLKEIIRLCNENNIFRYGAYEVFPLTNSQGIWLCGKITELCEYKESVNEESRIEDDKLPKYIYHISLQNHDGETFTPRVYENDNVEKGMERRVKRVCFSDSITRALYSIFPTGAYDSEFCVHIPDTECKLYKTTNEDIYDSEITHELWIKEPVKMKCIGKIKVSGVTEKAKILSVDKNKAGYGKKKYYETKWHWAEKYYKDESLYE